MYTHTHTHTHTHFNTQRCLFEHTYTLGSSKSINDIVMICEHADLSVINDSDLSSWLVSTEAAVSTACNMRWSISNFKAHI